MNSCEKCRLGLAVRNLTLSIRCPMKRLLLLLCPCMLIGCAYVENRARDAADMVTIAGEVPAVGASASVGPLGVGLHAGTQYGFGLRSGVIGSYEFQEWTFPVTWFKTVEPSSELDRRRKKGYEYVTGMGATGDWSNIGQVEVGVGVGAGVRVGVNVCEVADFAIGLVGIDICEDDIAIQQQRD